jgi:hypothetical protein
MKQRERLSKAELRELNRRLAQHGERFCPGCGATHPLTPGWWYFSRKGRDRTLLRPSDVCKLCFRLRATERERKRYQQDKAFRDRKKQYRVAWFADPVNRARHREHNRQYMRSKRLKVRRAFFYERLGR